MGLGMLAAARDVFASCGAETEVAVDLHEDLGDRPNRRRARGRARRNLYAEHATP
jgi:hypothetical protein